MKKVIAVLCLAAVLSGCTTSTAFGPCVGALDDKDPKLVYKLSVWNTILAVIFVGTVFVPVLVVANDMICPEGRK